MTEMVADALIGHGCEFWRWDATLSTPAYAQIGNVVDLTPPNLSRDTTDVTHMGSPGRWKEFIGAMRDPGEAKITIQFKAPSALDDLITDLQSDNIVKYQMIWPDADTTEWKFTAFVTAVEAQIPIADKMTGDITFKLSGKPTFLEG